MRRLLILGGTTEASAVAAALVDDPRFLPMLSFAGATRAPRAPLIPWRVGGFGGAMGLAHFLRDNALDLLIDATHPFAQQIKRNAMQAAALTGVKLLGVHRPAWQEGPGDHWQHVPDMEHAAAAIGPQPQRVLLTVGQKDLAAFRAIPRHHYIVRSVDAPDPASLPQGAEMIQARGPFRAEDELALLQRLDVSVLVTKNSGGSATAPKLAAARTCGVRVVMVDRPPSPDWAEFVPDAAGALRWLNHHAPALRGE